ncbi:hypothetical protein KFE25_000856 [Diacronema lutheri]|uniref:Mitoferrin n=2 Tax=Diacronema lutheri TaxID=2081491 RepID=A0A8J6CF21_DIALT|nr:hypothetical protein KFE25_000856 [Diacronema lutheri]
MEDFDEWDPARNTLAEHVVAGSSAGLAEHLIMFPVDTIKTRLQARPAACSSGCEASMVHCVRRLLREGPCAPWKGSGTVLLGCMPAHAAYFSIYESLKLRFGHALGQPDHPLCSSAAVAIASVAHDAIMTPMDVMKQRLQLGYHANVLDCARQVWRAEGFRAFYRSFGVTLLMNVPYAAVMGGTNEALRHLLAPHGTDATTSTYLLAGAGSGVVAATFTNPLDVVKTRLQTQHCAAQPELPSASKLPGAGALGPGARAGSSCGSAGGAGGGSMQMGTAPLGSFSAPRMGALVRTLPTLAGASGSPNGRPPYTSLVQALGRIYAEEGVRGFARGLGARALYHAPSVAISWTSYETVKGALGRARRGA